MPFSSDLQALIAPYLYQSNTSMLRAHIAQVANAYLRNRGVTDHEVTVTGEDQRLELSIVPKNPITLNLSITKLPRGDDLFL